MKQIERLQEIYKILKTNKVNLTEIISSLNAIGIEISIRQLQRDLEDIYPILNKNESLIASRNSKRVKYFFIKNNARKISKSFSNSFKIRNTCFFEAKLNPLNNQIIENLKTAIDNEVSVIVNKLAYDSTGDNFNFTESKIKFKPIEIIFHRGTYYVGGYNIEKKIFQIYEINQLKQIELIDDDFSNSNLNEKFNKELISRFGISKNINDEVYDIKLEFSSVTGNFIMNHFWHETQSFKVKKGKVIMTLFCGINRELLGWLFYWMYNVKIIEPKILQEYYKKTIEEINSLNSNKQPLVYKNIFNTGKKI